ncbi:MAG: hypothetical protein Q9187_003330 [Circinaria calcarea]
MPPKAQPKQQPPQRNVVQSSIEEPQRAPWPKGTVDESQDVSQNALTLKQTLQDRPMQPSFPTSQIPTSTSTASSTASPARRSAQRLDSLHRRSGPAAGPTSSVPGVSNSRPAGLKIQPKKAVLRRSKEEREAQDRVEEERRQASYAASRDDANVRGGQYGRGGGRGASRAGFRGGMSGWRTERRGVGQASGPLSMTTAPVPKKGKGSRGGYASSYTESSSGVKNEPVVKTEGSAMAGSKPDSAKIGGTKIKNEDHDPLYISSESESDGVNGPRINIEHINLLSDQEIDYNSKTIKSKGGLKNPKPPGWTSRPVRLDRQEHVERTVGVNTDASSLTSAELRRRARAKGEAEGSLFLPNEEENKSPGKNQKKVKAKHKDVEFVRDERKWKGVFQDEEDSKDDIKIKEEPKDDDNAMIVDSTGTSVMAVDKSMTKPRETSPKPKPRPMPRGPKKDGRPLPSKISRRGKAGFRGKKPVLQTEEDRQEWERFENDIKALTEELGSMGSGFVPVPAAKDAEGDLPMKDASEEKKDRRLDMVYLFQFPPVIPKLVDAINEATKVESADKPTAENAPTVPPKALPRDSTSAGISKTTDPVIKAEEGDPVVLSAKASNAFKGKNRFDVEGKIGRLTIYESGKVIISWGGMDHELGKGAEAELLQEVLLLNHRPSAINQEAAEATRVKARNAGLSLGQVTGGFVVTPEWSTMFE